MVLNIHILKTMDLDKTRNGLEKFTMGRFWVLSSASSFRLCLDLLSKTISMPKFVIPAALIYLFALMETIFGIYQSSAVLPIDYDMTGTSIQKKLETRNTASDTRPSQGSPRPSCGCL